MKLLPYLLAGLVGVCGCKKEESLANIEAGFNQQFTLAYAQTAYLPIQSASELTLTLDDVLDTRCPKNASCALAGDVQTVVGVQGQNGTKQVATLCLGCDKSTNLSDSAIVQANSRRYVLRLQTVTPVRPSAKSDYQAVLTVKR